MAWRFVSQPNGLLARFSDIVDNFTHNDLSELDAINLCVIEYGMGRAEAIEKVQGGIDDWKPWSNKEKGSGHDRWDDSLKTIRSVHGDKSAFLHG